LLLECPPDLSPVAREEWDRLLRDLPNVVKLTNVDGTMLALLCESIVLWREAMDGIRKYGAVIKTPSGFPVQSPYMAIANQQAANIEKISAEFGLSPGSRNKLPIMRYHEASNWELPALELPPLKL
jgi:P27 family predicted phage terminase small subunit